MALVQISDPPVQDSPQRASTTLRFRFFGQVLPAVVFGLLGVRQITNAVDFFHSFAIRPEARVFIRGLAAVLYAIFTLLPVVIYVLHRPPVSKDNRLAMRATALSATFLLLAVGAFSSSDRALYSPPVALSYVALGVLLLANVIEVYGIASLRLGFSISPEARKVAAEGPYRWIRHPLYAAEVAATLAVLALHPTAILIAAEGVFILLQVLRIKAEERLLADTFPDYRILQGRTRYRLIPFVW